MKVNIEPDLFVGTADYHFGSCALMEHLTLHWQRPSRFMDHQGVTEGFHSVRLSGFMDHQGVTEAVLQSTQILRLLA